jgi:hypothetical protein
MNAVAVATTLQAVILSELRTSDSGLGNGMQETIKMQSRFGFDEMSALPDGEAL